MKPKLIKSNLSGIEALQLIRKGHMVRRSCWVDEVYIRVCNEAGFDKQGNLIEKENTPLYTHSTEGFFLHIGYSSQPYRYAHYPRDGEGIGMLFSSDWEDYGFISASDFDKFTEEIKEEVRKETRKQKRR